MQEATRRQYLSLLGIEQWLPRGVEDPLLAEAALAAPAAALTPDAGVQAPAAGPAVTAALPAAASAPPRPELPPESAAKLDALLAQSATPARGPRPAPVMPPPAAEPLVSPVAAERVACSLLVTDDGLLVAASFATADAPGLSGPEHETLLRLAAALSPRISAMPVDLHWPPRGARVPGLDRPGAARQALQEALRARQRQGVRDLLVLGDALVPGLADAAARLGLNTVVAPSLATLVADPQAKRACWDLAKPLRRIP